MSKEYKPYVYIFENIEFREKFKGYHLCKIGYSQSPEERLTSMPKPEQCRIILKYRGGYAEEQQLKEEWKHRIWLHPYYGYFNRVKVKDSPYWPVKWESDKMFDYLNELRIGMGRTGWGYSEWFIVNTDL